VIAFKPYRLRKIASHLPITPIILEVGAGFHSPSITRKYIPHCVYYGIEKPGYEGINSTPNTRDDLDCIDRHILTDLEQWPNLEEHGVREKMFDAVIAANTLEHLAPATAKFYLTRLPQFLKLGGVFYVEVPSHRVFKCWLPSNYDGIEHRAFLDLADLINPILSTCEILEAGTRRDWRNILRSPLSLPVKLAFMSSYPTEYTDLLGLSYYVLAKRNR